MPGLDRAVLLGSGGHVPTGRRETGCALVVAGDRALVVDAGTGLRRLVTDPGLLDGVRAIDLVLTHFHLDHVVGLAYLSAVDPPVAVHGPGAALYGNPTATVLDRLLAPPFMVGLDRFVTGVGELGPGEARIGPFALRVREQPRHVHPTLALRLGDELAYCWSYAGEPRDLRAHASARQAAEVARDAGAGELVLIHPDPTLADDAALLAEARAVHLPSRLGEDLLELPLG